MLDNNMQAQLKAYLEKLTKPVELVANLDSSNKSNEIKQLLNQIAALSDKITVREVQDNTQRVPSFLITNPGVDSGLRFAGSPLGHEFTSLVLALLQIGGHPSKEAQELLDQVKALEGEFHFETYYSLSCHNCPDVVQALNLMAVLNPNITHTAIDGALFQNEIEERNVMGVPAVFLNGKEFGQGRMTLSEIINKVDTNADARAAKALTEREPFEVLIIGSGPAGASAAVYTARKGIRTGVIGERFGGQVMDTVDIENYISVLKTEGAIFAGALKNHVDDYNVDVIDGQSVTKLIPATEEGGYHQIETASGGVMKSRSIIIATGARWRNMGVPGEQEYRTKGVTFCPHCDGPLFKGKRVAVIGGGNSGIEAAIDLAGIVEHVTVLEFAPELKADSVLQDKARSLKNVDIIVNAQTLEVKGDGSKMTGLEYKDRTDDSVHLLEVAGAFVQIGLLPNTNWLGDTVARNRIGEIEVDARGETNVKGVFAAGDCTTVPYKQIIISAGEGAKAALSAFDYLIRTSTRTAE
ncbi:alkyl hydroperoxide reductase subunit F [Providencia stuartii]|uniref:Alkyl hydroperoxide reductase subunit F n=1 Tax=Providencia stuartii (strain MRSN 2154) TaxID=1157951 RepID=A0A140STD0_PROSM|nr:MULTISPECIES: alkyl hydroperoxide reductase subunit F [Providencia]AFH95907.1 alkyl hydroperoxide reductase subunit F [Providencia stuartii MRSN 2154]MDE8744802.1 alkyl hydroperoxide reductase subunit F [Providencia thailandensis]MDE8766021.1 alkyl hydroperoxide reductase subunit F [Providencia thailandensis]MDE8778244.1 alkyl hydroperoxide reductase subunit F [Providencia thailandensis]MDE8782500.1 alkyl hydroperoxide reductase subunit F [Providencia thailandensis]